MARACIDLATQAKISARETTVRPCLHADITHTETRMASPQHVFRKQPRHAPSTYLIQLRMCVSDDTKIIPKRGEHNHFCRD
jgi:hypothetical protein